MDQIDWKEQWALHARGYSEGYLHLDLTLEGAKRILRLKPGPGFGDLSHPTTRLMLQTMPHHVAGRHVLDVGCGSGILSVAAAALGAASVAGIDIDPAAIEHAFTNNNLNELDIPFMLPDEYCAKKTVPKKLMVLMNMIQSEQSIAWESLKQIHPHVSTILTSGILSDGVKTYLEQTSSWGWHLVEQREEEGWWCGLFQ